VLKRAIEQQCFFMKLFATEPLYHITKGANMMVSNHLRPWHALFYPDTEEAQHFQFINKMRQDDNNPFDPEGLTPYMDAASSEAIRLINVAVKSLP
jgi:hypothetical protein